MTVVAAVARTADAEALLEEAAVLRDAFDTELHVVHVISTADFLDYERASFEQNWETVPIDRVRDVATDVADEIAAKRLPESGYTAVGLVGEVDDEVIEYAERNSTDYLVIGGRGRSPVGKAVFGSTAQSILLHADCPIVSV